MFKNDESVIIYNEIINAADGVSTNFHTKIRYKIDCYILFCMQFY